MKIRFAVAPGGAATDLDRFAPFVRDLEALGFDTVWLSDLPLGPSLDPLVGLAHAAAATERLKLGANVVPFGRSPFALAKSLAQLDHLSGGRVLLSFVVGLDQPGERDVLGTRGAHRGRLLEELVPLVRTWWSGGTVDHHGDAFDLPALGSPGRSRQQPLEVWFGGRGPAALARAGRLADGWLGAAVPPEEAADARSAIAAAAAEVGREVDPEHYGMSIPYARSRPEPSVLEAVRRRRPDADPEDLLPVGPSQLGSLVERYVGAGISKFVVRPVDAAGDARRALESLAGVLLPLQT